MSVTQGKLPLIRCYICEKPGTVQNPLKTCSKCKCARYCSADHQKQDWPKHKRFCATLDPVLSYLDHPCLLAKNVDPNDLKLIFASPEGVEKLLKVVQVESDGEDDEIKRKLPHQASELLISEWGEKLLQPIIFDFHLGALFRFFGSTSETEHPRMGTPCVPGFLTLLVSLLKNKRAKELIVEIQRNDNQILYRLLPYMHVKEISDLIVEAFQYDSKNAKQTSKLIKSVFDMIKSEKHAPFVCDIVAMLLGSKYATDFNNLFTKNFSSMIKTLSNATVESGTQFECLLKIYSLSIKKFSSNMELLGDLIEFMKDPGVVEPVQTHDVLIEKPFGMNRLFISNVFDNIDDISNHKVLTFLQIGLDLMFQYPNCNMFHSVLLRVLARVARTDKKAIRSLFSDNLFFSRVNGILNEENS